MEGHSGHSHAHGHSCSRQRQAVWAWKGWDSRCTIRDEVFKANDIGEKAFISVQRGNIPVLITVPHDGVGAIPHIQLRTRGTTVRDTKSALVADELRCCIEELLNPHHSRPQHLDGHDPRTAPTNVHGTSEEDAHVREEAKELRMQLVRLLRQKYDQDENQMQHQGHEVLTHMKQSGRLEDGEEDVLAHILRSVEEMNNRDIHLRPYIVVANFSRTYCDLNRNIKDAFDDQSVAPYYLAYHEIIRRYIIEINNLVEGTDFPPILLDVHGQGASSETTYRGTGRGKTVKKLIEERGIEALNGEHSILGYLERKCGYHVVPSYTSNNLEEEDERFSGGYTVTDHGSSNSGEDHIDAIQLELGQSLRCKHPKRDVFSLRLAEATLHFLHHYGQTPKQKTTHES